MGKYILNQTIIAEKNDESLVLLDLKLENVYVLNASAIALLQAVLDSSNVGDAKTKYFLNTKHIRSEQSERDFDEFNDFLISEGIIIKE